MNPETNKSTPEQQHSPEFQPGTPVQPVAPETVVQPTTQQPAAPAARPAPPARPGDPMVFPGSPSLNQPANNPAPLNNVPVTPPSPPPQNLATKKRPKKRLLILLLAVLLLAGSAAAFYFGYYANPTVIYKQALENTGKGYDKLIDYTETQSKQGYKAFSGQGSYDLNMGGSSNIDGKLALQADDKNGQMTFDVGAAGTRVNADVRFFTAENAETADVYIKARGIKDLAAAFGFEAMNESVNNFDDKWIFIDHTLLELPTEELSTGAAAVKQPTEEQILDEMRAFGKVNQEYLFTTEADKAVTKIVKQHGSETLNGHKTQHYTVALQKANVKKYITAQRDALKQSKLYDWIKENKYEDIVEEGYKSLISEADTMPSDVQFDLWADQSKRLIYKIRPYGSDNPAKNFVDVGLDYKGGSKYPFFISGQFTEGKETTTFNMTAELDTEASSLSYKLNGTGSGASSGSFKAEFTMKLAKQPPKIAKPTEVITLPEVLKQLGMEDYLSLLQTSLGGGLNDVYSGSQAKARDTKRKMDTISLQTALEVYFSENGHYPSLADFNSSAWRKTNMKAFDEYAMRDPSAADSDNQSPLVASPTPGAYAYRVTNAAGGSCEADAATCTKYDLIVTLEVKSDGDTYTRSNLD